MARREYDTSNMFAVLEHQERTALFPSPRDHEACSVFYGQIIARYNAAMLAADTATAVKIKDECELFYEHIYVPHKETRGVCLHDMRKRVSEQNRPAEGALPMWVRRGHSR